ncbi:MAG: membrane protein [Pseudohongiella sp.]|nr:MAG: membrane protein [Pseudohongiella sp.]
MIELLALLLMLLVVAIWIYNLLIKDRNQVLAAWSDIDVQLKRRHDLIPQLVTAVKAYSDHEQATMLAVTELRNKSELAEHLPDKALIEKEIETAVTRLSLVAEAYPDLKSDENFRQLSENLSETEEHIQYARRFYNGSVRIFNTRIQSFPQVLVAKPFNFKAAEYFEVDDQAQRLSPTVELD